MEYYIEYVFDISQIMFIVVIYKYTTDEMVFAGNELEGLWDHHYHYYYYYYIGQRRLWERALYIWSWSYVLL